MLEPKSTLSRTTIIWILVAIFGIAGITTLVFAFGGPNTPEEDVNAVYTNAALTVEAQQLTLLAAQPSATTTPTITLTPSPTNTAFATLTLGAFATNPQPAVVTGGCDNSVYVSDVTIPDNTAVTPGQSMTKTWKVQNSGTCAWTATYKISFVGGNAMGGTATAIGQAVSPGQSVDVSVAMVAPSAAGDAAGTWRLINDKSVAFGTQLTIVVKVGGTASTTVAGTPGTATVTPTGGAPKPAAANNPTTNITCNLDPGGKYTHTGTLDWADESNNESGFHIYINGMLAFTTGTGVTSYTVPASFPAGTLYDAGATTTFGVGAFNGAGEAAVANVAKTCP